jgi:uncharacterized protein YrzB (UPF0473 family)
MVRLFALQPNLVDAFSFNDIDFKSMFDKPTACFVVMPDEKTTYHGLVSLFIKQSYEILINSYQSTARDKPLRINYVLDEFSSLPTISDFPAMITAARSRNIRFNLILQSKHQLQKRYEQESETIQDNCTNWIFLTSKEIKLLQELSLLCGTDYLDNGANRPVISIEELQRLDKDMGEALILSGRNKPYIARLPDIEVYGKFTDKTISFLKRDIKKRVELEFDEYKMDSDDSFDFSSPNKLLKNNVEIDEYILNKSTMLYHIFKHGRNNKIVLKRHDSKPLDIFDDTGDSVRFDVLSVVKYAENEYILMTPYVDPEDDDVVENDDDIDIYMMKLTSDTKEGKPVVLVVEDEKLIDTIHEIFNSQNSDDNADIKMNTKGKNEP